MQKPELKELLDSLEERYNNVAFIKDDPISIPHKFSAQQDIEIAGLFAAIFAWGQRKTIINKCNSLLDLMDNAPHDFVLNYGRRDLKRMSGFVHRTFNSEDLTYFLKFLKHHYKSHQSLETLFTKNLNAQEETIENGLINFRESFLSLPHLKRTEKHLSSPLKNSACKRINMYLRWMVRKDNRGVDFGIWNNIQQSQLLCPLDVHVIRVAQKFGMLNNAKSNWTSCVDLTNQLRELCPEDPVKYDFALFGFGIENKNNAL